MAVRNIASDDAAGTGGETVGAVASLVGVTVRALHHWDSIGLVKPSARTPAGYRLYTASDVARIHRILIYRELGLSLEDIAELLDSPSSEAVASLQQQRAQLTDRITLLQRMVDGVDRMIDAASRGILLTSEEQVAIFGDMWKPAWVAEAQERWGESAQWAQYAERAATMGVEDWQQVADEGTALNNALAVAMRTGVSPGTAEADRLAERHRAWIGTHFDCTHSMHVCLARSYTDNPDFAEYYDSLTSGLAVWLREVIEANAAAHGVDPATATWD